MKEVFEITKKDLKIEFRSKGTLNFMILFSLVVSFMFSVAIPKSVANDVALPLLLLTFIFVSMLGYSRAFLREVELETLDGLRAIPISPTSVLTGKIIYNCILMLIVEITVLPIFFAIFNLKISFVMLFLFISVGNLSLVIAISALSMLTVKSKAKELLMPVILFPIVFPVISPTIVALNSLYTNDINLDALLIIGVYTVMILTVSILTFEYLFIE